MNCSTEQSKTKVTDFGRGQIRKDANLASRLLLLGCNQYCKKGRTKGWRKEGGPISATSPAKLASTMKRIEKYLRLGLLLALVLSKHSVPLDLPKPVEAHFIPTFNKASALLCFIKN